MAGFSYDAGTGEAGRATSSSPRNDPRSDWDATASGGDAQASLDSNDVSKGQGAAASSSEDNDVAGQGGDGPLSHADAGATSHAEGGASGAGRAGNAAGGSAGAAGKGRGGAGGGAGSGGAGGKGGTGGTLARGGSSGRAGSGGDDGAHAGDGGGGRVERALLFSEYVEGPAKAVELRALATSSLDGCEVVIYSNGGTKGAGVALAGELAEGQTYVLCSTDLVEQLGAVCNRTFGRTFNGNDAVTLECDGAVLDAIGEIGFDPKTAWTGSGVSTADQALRRRCSVTHGDTVATDPFDPSLEWQSHPVDELTGLGLPDCD
ncbi:MAG TPA: hypothetical protein VFV94_17690 [Polyangiaceae bacterium]|nr:hypothetical protein [Polyangiaceae bacterium]